MSVLRKNAKDALNRKSNKLFSANPGRLLLVAISQTVAAMTWLKRLSKMDKKLDAN